MNGQRAMLQHLLAVELHLGVSARRRSGDEQMELIKATKKTVITPPAESFRRALTGIVQKFVARVEADCVSPVIYLFAEVIKRTAKRLLN
jgi:hypothetical protein